MKNTEELIRDRVQILTADTPAQAVSKRVLILSTARTGSTLFCDVLANTGLCGRPEEWFKEQFFNAYKDFTGSENLSFSAYVGLLMSKTSSENGVFCVNAHIGTLMDWQKRGVNIMDFGFDHVFYLSRKNKVEQAVSYAKAVLDDQWVEKSAARKTEQVAGYAEIAQALAILLQMQDIYEQKLSHLVDDEYFYEDFCSIEKSLVFKKFFRKLGIDDSGLKFHSKIKKQAGIESKRAAVKFLRYISSSV